MAYKYSNVEYTEMVRMVARCDDNVLEACRQYAIRFPKIPTPSRATMQAATQRLRECGQFRHALNESGGRPPRHTDKPSPRQNKIKPAHRLRPRTKKPDYVQAEDTEDPCKAATQHNAQMTMKVVQANEQRLLEIEPPKRTRNRATIEKGAGTEKEEMPLNYIQPEEIKPQVCPKCCTVLPDSFLATQTRHKQVRSIIARVYHFLEREYEQLKSLHPETDWSPLSRVRQRAAVATGVSEPDVLDILSEEADTHAADEDPPRKRPRTEHESEYDDVNEDEQIEEALHEPDVYVATKPTLEPNPLEDSEEEQIFIKEEPDDVNITYDTVMEAVSVPQETEDQIDSQDIKSTSRGRSRGRGRGSNRPEKPQPTPSLKREACPLVEVPEVGVGKPTAKSEPAAELELELEPQPPEVDFESMDIITLGERVEAKMQPSTEHRTSTYITDKHFDSIADNWLQDNDSDIDLDPHFNDNDGISVPVMRNATTEPACDADMTELETHVLRTEDEINDQALRDIMPTNDYYTFDWKKDKPIFTGRREAFTGSSGPTFDITDKTPVDIFSKIFDTSFIDRLCTETNRYAEQKIARLKEQNKLLPTSRLHRWTPTDRSEMITFLAVLVLQGLYPLPEEEKYFSFNGFGTMPYFSRIMSFNRFILLKSLYHFVDNETLTNKTRLSKIQPVLDHLNEKFSTLYMPGQDIAIDESLLKWHGRLSFAQKIATRAAQVGVKTYELCESRTGYLWKFFVYVGKNTEIAPTDDLPTDDEMVDQPDDEIVNRPIDQIIDQSNVIVRDRPINKTPDQPQDATVDQPNVNFARPTNATAKIVFDLLEPLLDRGHTVVMDNFYNSPLLLRCLKKHKTDCYGTLRLNREFVPDSLRTLNKTDLRQGEVVASYTSDLSAMVWRDANLVSMISTYHHIQAGIQNEYNRLTYKPKIVLDYNMSMAGMDRKDQLLSAQPVERYRNKLWYKKVFCRLLNTAIFNAYVIFSSQNPKISYRQFRTILAEDLLKIHRGIDLTTEPRLYADRGRQGQLSTRTNDRPNVDHDHFPTRVNSSAGETCRDDIVRRDKQTTISQPAPHVHTHGQYEHTDSRALHSNVSQPSDSMPLQVKQEDITVEEEGIS
ncbi:uncharacterized protein LOC124643893 [Helicoverpa zea]|uniref:uncharacterized protein LOC124643893 n=1 Tax=Helicoverpa zea TaxID=7113 RepID=UPI001F5AF14A|nr:uncharacterized protein LOC124643893 [Helicoverpa zea]